MRYVVQILEIYVDSDVVGDKGKKVDSIRCGSDKLKR